MKNTLENYLLRLALSTREKPAFGTVNKRKAHAQFLQIIIDMRQLTSENDIFFYEETWDSNIK